VIKVQDARIVSIDEYFDGSIYAEIWARIATLGTD
jgi:ketosteroid isomerase-like protein